MWTYNYIYPSELYHHGVKGQKWGVRRYQNPDGSLTTAGYKKYYKLQGKIDKINKKEKEYSKKIIDDRKWHQYKRDAIYDVRKSIAKKRGNIEKFEKIKAKQKAFNDDYNEGTKLWSKASSNIKRGRTQVLKLKQKSLSDPSIRKSENYKAAKKLARKYNGTLFNFGRDQMYINEVADLTKKSR